MKIEWFLLFLVIEGVMYLNIREQAEEREFQYLSRYASHSRESKGRERVEDGVSEGSGSDYSFEGVSTVEG